MREFENKTRQEFTTQSNVLRLDTVERQTESSQEAAVEPYLGIKAFYELIIALIGVPFNLTEECRALKHLGRGGQGDVYKCYHNRYGFVV